MNFSDADIIMVLAALSESTLETMADELSKRLEKFPELESLKEFASLVKEELSDRNGY